ncbi:hypothetical protein FLAN108750_11165 [Flavobacterium antarcticum]|uniref:hypothetical protein n=1 Tax=Flavobacterium antarcticum TaxID=271155 RepID=UPI0003B422D2|nr:hypothetical protein [Flavobacterium antarcticum]
MGPKTSAIVAEASRNKQSSKYKKSWSPTSKRFVCFLDIMGFKDLVMRNSHKDIYELLNKLSKHRDDLENTSSLPEQYDSDTLKTVSFSDSIVIFTKDDRPECFEVLTFAVGWLFSQSLIDGIPMKGAIAFGEMSVNISSQIFFGQPLIDAYLLEEEVNYYGIVVHDTVERYFDEYNVNKNIQKLYIDCLTPLKSGKINHLNLNWISSLNLQNDIDINEKEKALSLMLKQRRRTSGYPRKYIDNTSEVINLMYK